MTQKNKTIILLRHGKSAWDQVELDDIKRTLLPKGIERTKRSAHYIKEVQIKIEKVISSPANRALETANIVKDYLHLSSIEIENRLYPCDSEQIYNTIIELDDAIDHVLIVAHNTGLTYFAQEYMDANIDNIPTSGLVSCRYTINSWSEFALADRKLNFVVFPKNLS